LGKRVVFRVLIQKPPNKTGRGNFGGKGKVVQNGGGMVRERRSMGRGTAVKGKREA